MKTNARATKQNGIYLPSTTTLVKPHPNHKDCVCINHFVPKLISLLYFTTDSSRSLLQISQSPLWPFIRMVNVQCRLHKQRRPPPLQTPKYLRLISTRSNIIRIYIILLLQAHQFSYRNAECQSNFGCFKPSRSLSLEMTLPLS